MKALNERNFIRILHRVLSVPILGYLYGPVASIPRAAGFTRWFAMPVVVLTGLWLWFKPRLLNWLRRHSWDSLRNHLLCIATGITLTHSVMMNAQSASIKVGDTLPTLSAVSVTGKPLTLPSAAAGKNALVIFTFGRSSGKDGQVWNARLAKDFPSPVPNYTFIFAESVPKMFQGRALSGIRSGMPKEMQDRAALMLRDEQKWRATLGIEDDQRAYVLLLDSNGRIAWRNASVFSEADYALVRTRLMAQ